MSSKLEPVIWLRVLVTLAYMNGRTSVRTYVLTDVHDVMAIKPNFLTAMGYHIFLTMVLCARAPSSGTRKGMHYKIKKKWEFIKVFNLRFQTVFQPLVHLISLP